MGNPGDRQQNLQHPAPRQQSPDLHWQVRGLSLLLADAAAALPPADAHAAKLRLKRMHFATLPVPAMRNWLPALLRQWRSPRHMLIASSGTTGVLLMQLNVNQCTLCCCSPC